MYRDSRYALPAGNLPLLSPFSPVKCKQTDLRKRIQWGKKGFYLLLQPHQCSSRTGTSVPAHLHCGTCSHLCCQYFSRDISSLLLLPPKSVASHKWPQVMQEHKQLLWWRPPTHTLRLLSWKKKPAFYMPEVQQNQIPVLKLISPQSDMKHHVNPTKEKSETSQLCLVIQAPASLLHCPSTPIFLGNPNMTVDHKLSVAGLTRNFLTSPVFLVLKYSIFISPLIKCCTRKTVLPNFCIKHDIFPNALWSIEFLKRNPILKTEIWRQKPRLIYYVQSAPAFSHFTMIIYEF